VALGRTCAPLLEEGRALAYTFRVPRLFFAIGLPLRVTEQLERMAEGIPSARWVPEDNYHLTLSFLGEVPARQLRDVLDAAKAVRAEPFSLSFEGVGTFPKRPPARVLWAGLRSEPLLGLLQRRLERALKELGFGPDDRKFRAHVTLARLGREAPRGAVHDWLAEHIGFCTEPFPVTRFQLVSSVLTPGGSEYQVEGTFPLRR